MFRCLLVCVMFHRKTSLDVVVEDLCNPLASFICLCFATRKSHYSLVGSQADQEYSHTRFCCIAYGWLKGKITMAKAIRQRQYFSLLNG
jgi:hypothetical protein